MTAITHLSCYQPNRVCESVLLKGGAQCYICMSNLMITKIAVRFSTGFPTPLVEKPLVEKLETAG